MRDLLEISREIRSIAQTGRSYSRDNYDLDRHARLEQIATELLSQDAGLKDFCWPVETGYLTPKVDVRGFIFRDDQLLMVREASSGKWSVPGGWADVNLTPAENVERECFEETGFSVRAERIISVLDRDRAGYPRNPESIYKIHFLCLLLSGEARTNFETTQVGFFPADQLPEIDEGRIRVQDIADARACLRGNDNGTCFQKTEDGKMPDT